MGTEGSTSGFPVSSILAIRVALNLCSVGDRDMTCGGLESRGHRSGTSVRQGGVRHTGDFGIYRVVSLARTCTPTHPWGYSFHFAEASWLKTRTFCISLQVGLRRVKPPYSAKTRTRSRTERAHPSKAKFLIRTALYTICMPDLTC